MTKKAQRQSSNLIRKHLCWRKLGHISVAESQSGEALIKTDGNVHNDFIDKMYNNLELPQSQQNHD